LLQAKFFERRKIERKIEKAKREVAAEDCTPDAKAAAVEKLAEYEGDLEVGFREVRLFYFPDSPAFSALFVKLLNPNRDSYAAHYLSLLLTTPWTNRLCRETILNPDLSPYRSMSCTFQRAKNLSPFSKMQPRLKHRPD
jgi:hypothetical protein